MKPLGFIDAIDAIRPHVLIGATGAPGTFTQTVIERMSSINERPAIFALSNPTSRAECTAEQAYAWSGGRAIFASGSPFGPVTYRRHDVPAGAGQQRVRLPRHRPRRRGLPRAHAAGRVVPDGGADACRPGSADRSRPGLALSAVAGHQEDLARDRDQRRDEGVCDESGAKETTKERAAERRGDDVSAVTRRRVLRSHFEDVVSPGR